MADSPNLDFWHLRYTQQAGWTSEARRYIFRQIGVNKSASILEVGSGTGAVLSSLYNDGYTHLFGLDIDRAAMAKSAHGVGVNADAHHLPFPSGTFSVTICHFLMLWVKNPLFVLEELRRTTRPGGWTVALAEPDYSHRTDKPAELEPLGAAQTASLIAQGADVSIGARLGELFRRAGLENIEMGVITPQVPELFTGEEFELEWAVLRRDLAGRAHESQLQHWYDLDRLAGIRGNRQRYVPVHFAFGQVP
jgi:SAM-dependent methyltransferase